MRAITQLTFITALSIIISCFPFTLVSQQLVDSSNKIYEYFSIWNQKGYISNLPVMRPYPIEVIKVLLEQVVQVGKRSDRELAKRYLTKFNYKKLSADELEIPSVGISVFSNYKLKGDDQKFYSGITIHSLGFLGDGVSFGGYFDYRFEPAKSAFIDLKYRAAQVPLWNIGPSFTFGDTQFTGYVDTAVDFVIGTTQTYLQMGLVKPGFGSTISGNVVVDSDISPTPRISITHQEDWYSLSGSLYELKALNAVTKSGDLYSLGAGASIGSVLPTKYMTLHVANFQMASKLEIGAFQMSVFGQRISLYNVLPLPFIITEPYMGNYDNILGGLTAKIGLPFQTAIDLLLFIDDWQLVEGWHYSSTSQQLNIDPFANKTAGQITLAWAPTELAITRFSLAYLFIAPYMYTHSSHALLNYLTYTHNGYAIGSSLKPNSDQWMIRANISPGMGLFVESSFRFIRHANGSDHGEGSVDGDGSIWDDGYTSSGGATFYGDSTFLNQSVIEEIFQFEVEIQYELVQGIKEAKTKVTYGFEHIKNKDLIVNNVNTISHMLSIGLELAI